MSNIHSLADYRRDGAAPYRAGAAPATSPTPLVAGGRSNFGTIGGLRAGSGETMGSGAPQAGGFNEVGYSYEVRASHNSAHTQQHSASS